MPLTPRFGVNMPTVSADVDTWGDENNATHESWDGLLYNFVPPAVPLVTTVGFLGMPQNIQNANYTLVMADAGKDIIHTNSTAYAWTIPPDASVPLPLGILIGMTSTGTGLITITRGAAVSLYINGDLTDANRILNQNGSIAIKKVLTNTWLLFGPVT